MAEVLKISKATFDALTTTDERNLLFTSENNTLKIFIDRQDTIANAATLNIAHGLSYPPLFMAFEQDSAGRWVPNDAASIGTPAIISEVDTTNVSITNNDGASRVVRTFVFIDDIL